jgi:hypothetical protein
MTVTILDRRAFIRRALEATAVVAVAATGTTTIAADNGAWAMDLKTMDANDAAVLLRMARHLYPHDALGDIYYAVVVQSIDGKAATDPELAALVKNGVAALDHAMPVPWLQLSDGYQLQTLEAIEHTPFFQAVRGNAVVALYNNKNVWPFFGYQGSSFEYGGYLERGFQDAGWTGEPPPEASPEAFFG